MFCIEQSAKQPLFYDSIGNPTSYHGATLTWRGRELTGYQKGNEQISYSYDVDGMRYGKVVNTNGVESARYDYVYSDGTLILLTYTANGVSQTARFVYDSWGEPRGFMLNDSATYLYLKNAQGDITGIVDENGAVLLTYSYTAWGEVTYSATNMQSLALAVTLSKVNPFTYRGYCYDYDIGMYYLQSRYYDPEICRFINADSTEYLGASGTLLSYNLFAYCENDGVNAVDYEGNYIFYTFKKNASNKQIKSYARKLMESPNVPEFFENTKVRFYPNGPYRAAFTYYSTKQYVKLKQVEVTYCSVVPASTRVVGLFKYKTVKQWEACILSQYPDVLLKYRDRIMKKFKMDSGDYEDFMDALSEASTGTPVGNIVEYYSCIEFVLELTQKYRKPADRYLLECLENIKHQYGEKANKYYVMFYWSVTYFDAVSTYRGITWRKRKTITIYDIF